MTEIFLRKSYGILSPANPEAEEIIAKMKQGQIMALKFLLPRNYGFLKKFFALLNVGFENWNPGKIDHKHGIPEKNFDRFRNDVTILAGYFDTTIRLDGSVRVEARSISFAKMTAETFEKLYSAVVNVLIKHVYGKDMDREKIDHIVDEYLRFA